ncbi:Uncharacterised protein [Mycobacteroides abscessus subsp. abscessus]|nr:Uncharacterised protein [Mycobacteroides abscessus subsp. abscessus]
MYRWVWKLKSKASGATSAELRISPMVLSAAYAPLRTGSDVSPAAARPRQASH